MNDPRETELKNLLAAYPSFKAKDKLALPSQPMPAQDPTERRRNIQEVPFGYDSTAARLEACRCLECRTAPCVKGCPVAIDIPAFVVAIREDRFDDAISIIRQSNCLPAVTGRVCPQEIQCQAECTVGKAHKDPEKAVSIGRLERFVADWERKGHRFALPSIPPDTGRRAAVVGAGPAGLAVAGDLRRLGHDVTIFEAFHKPGGVLIYGIPEFRLPKEIVKREVGLLSRLGVHFEMNVIIGQTLSVDELFEEEGYHAVFIGTGAGLPYFMNIPGEELIGVYSANEYLTRANLMQAYSYPQTDTPFIPAKKVAVFGGGNVAMDAARTALRLGAEKVMLIYRRSRDEMPARREEIHHAEEEGIELHLLTNPVAILPDERGWVKSVRCQRMELGEPDASGRRTPVAVPGSEFELETDLVVESIGNGPNPLVPATTKGLDTSRRGNILVDPETCRTSKRGVFAGGDIVLGAATVILAMGQGRRAARSMHDFMTTEIW